MSAFNEAYAVLLHQHGAVTIDIATVGLQPEANLLIHPCTITARREKLRELNAEGILIFRADFDPTLRWDVAATVLEYEGLADYHPGTRLSRQALTFVQANRIPHQFLREADGDEVGVLFYEDPTDGIDGGDTTEINFGITLEFSDLDTTNHPGEETLGDGYTSYVPPAVPDAPTAAGFIEIPAQPATALSAAGRTAILQGAFLSTDNLGGPGSPSAQLYAGDPATDGEPIGDALTLDPWTDLDEPDNDYTTVASNDTQIDWPDFSWLEKTLTHIRFMRGSVVIADAELETPLTIPANYTVRAPVDALSLELAWPLDGVPLPSTDDLPSRQFMRWLQGTLILGDLQPSANMTVAWHDDDFSPGTDIDTLTPVAANVSRWLVSGVTVTPVDIESGNAAPPGGWTIDSVIVTLPGGLVILRELFGAPYFVAEGDSPVFTTSPILDLDEPHDV